MATAKGPSVEIPPTISVGVMAFCGVQVFDETSGLVGKEKHDRR